MNTLGSSEAPEAGPVVVREWQEADTDDWDAYVRSHPRATFFHQIGWKQVLERTFRYRAHYLLGERSGRLCGVLPMFLCRSIRGTRDLFSLPHTVYGGMVGEDRAVEEALLESAHALATRVRARSIQLRNRHTSGLDLPRQDGFVTFEKELPSVSEEVYRTFPKKAREAINQAVKRHKLVADFHGDLDSFYDLVAASYHRLGTPVFPKRYFSAMLEEFPEEISILLVRHEGAPVSAVLCAEYRDTMHPLFSGEAEDVRHLKSNNFKYFVLMERAVERGLRKFDFGRSRTSNQGAVGFKRNQGFEDEALPYQTVSLSGGADEAPDPGRGLFLRARGLWRRLPARVARSLGPRVVKYFP